MSVPRPFAPDALTLLLFDLDGVLLSENPYRETARRTVHELVEDPTFLGLKGFWGDVTLPTIGQHVIPDRLVYALKNHAVNSNWDLTYVATCLHLAALLDARPSASSALLDADLPADEILCRLGVILAGPARPAPSSPALLEPFLTSLGNRQGADVLAHMQAFIQRRLGTNSSFFAPKSALWDLCYHVFQDWYEGRKDSSFEIRPEPIVPLDRLTATFQRLQQANRFTFGVATGRPRNEALEPLRTLGLLPTFDSARILTYDDVFEAEATQPDRTLGKPHPFVLLKAIYPNDDDRWYEDEMPEGAHPTVAYIGDAASDIVAARRAGCVAIGVLTGFGEDEDAQALKRDRLNALGCDLLLDSVLEVPKALGLD